MQNCLTDLIDDRAPGIKDAPSLLYRHSWPKSRLARMAAKRSVAAPGAVPNRPVRGWLRAGRLECELQGRHRRVAERRPEGALHHARPHVGHARAAAGLPQQGALARSPPGIPCLVQGVLDCISDLGPASSPRALGPLRAHVGAWAACRRNEYAVRHLRLQIVPHLTPSTPFFSQHIFSKCESLQLSASVWK